MNKYLLIFLLIFNTTLKVWADSNSKNNPPQAVMEAVQDVVFVSSEYGEGSGFIIRDDKNRAVLVTAYHIVREVIGKPNKITVKDAHRKQLTVKKVLSYSKRLDTVFLELESYDRKGLKLVDSHFDDSENIFVLGAFWNQLHLAHGVGFNNSSRDFIKIITDKDFYSMKGFSGGPVLNEYGEVMGMIFGGHIFYQYADVSKITSMKKVLESSKNKHSVVNLIPYNLYYIRYMVRGSDFVKKTNFQRLQALSHKGSINAQKTLKRLDMGAFIKLSVSISLLPGLTMGAMGLLEAETLGDMLFFVPSTAFLGYLYFNYCAEAFTHFKNKTLSRIQKN